MIDALTIARLRRARLAVAIAFAALGVAFGTWSARLPAIKEALGLSTSELGLVLAAFSASSIASLPVLGGVVGRIGTRPVLAVSAVLYGAMLPLVALAPTVPLLVAAAAAFGLAGTGFDIAVNAQGAHVEERYERPIFSGLHAAFSVGVVVAAGAAVPVARADVDVALHFAVAGAVTAAMVVAPLAWLLREPRREQAPRLTWPTRALAVAAAIGFCSLLVEDVANTWTAVYTRDVTGADAGFAAASVSVFAAAMIVGRLIADPVVARVDPRGFIAASGLVVALGVGIASLAPTPVIAALGFAFVGLGVGPLFPLALAHAAARDARGPGAGIAGVASVSYFGSIVGPPAVGAIGDIVGLRVALALVAMTGAAVAVLASRLPARSE